MKYLSCDGHLVEPLEALPEGATYQGATRQLLILPEGYDRTPMPVWTSVGNGHYGLGGGLKQPLGLDDRPEAYDPVARAAYCQEKGVVGEILYPTFAALAVETAVTHRKAREAAERYNRWVRETFMAVPAYPLYLDPAWNNQLLIRELEDERFFGFGAGVLLPQQPGDRELRWRDFVPAFEVAAHLGLPLHWHAFTRPTPESFHKDPLVLAWEGIRAGQDILLELILNGIFRKVPTLKVVLAEMDCGWVGHFQFRLQNLVSRYARAANLDLTVHDIRDAFDNNIHFVCQSTGEIQYLAPMWSKVLWGWDFPHSDAVSVPSGAEHIMRPLNDRAAGLYPMLAGLLGEEDR